MSSTIQNTPTSSINISSNISSNGKNRIDFDSAEPQAIEFGLKGREFILREASHDTARKYRSRILESYTPNAAGDLVPTPKLPNAEVVLIAGCSFEKTSNGEVPVTETEVLTWPNRATTFLLKNAKEMSHMTERDMSTPESLEKEIGRLQIILDEMRKDQKEGTQAGNLLKPGTVNSA